MGSNPLESFDALAEELEQRFRSIEYDGHGSAISIETACNGLVADQLG